MNKIGKGNNYENRKPLDSTLEHGIDRFKAKAKYNRSLEEEHEREGTTIKDKHGCQKTQP